MATKIQLRGDTAANWTSTNPVLAPRELAVETDTMFYKIGNGTTPWNSLGYGGLAVAGTATVIDYTGIAVPAAPATNHLKVFTKAIAGRMMLRTISPYGANYALQPALFNSNIFWLTTGSSNAYMSIGQLIGVTGVVSHPVQTELFGYFGNSITTAAANNTCGAGTTNPSYMRGTLANGANGFFFKARLLFPDATYDTTGAATGSRIFAGLTTNSFAAMVNGSTLPANDIVGFTRNSETAFRVETNWQFITKDGTSQTLTDTGVPFLPSKVFDLFLYCPPMWNQMFWRIENVTDGVSNEGLVTDTLPVGASLMRAGVQLGTVNALARNMRIQHIYVESDR